MALATRPRIEAPTASRGFGGGLRAAALVAVGAALLVAVGHDGSPPWQTVRVVATIAATWAIYIALNRGHRGWRGAIGFATGCVGVALGVGFGLSHLVKGGLGVLSLAGLLGLAGGLVLVAAGAVTLVRATPRWRRVIVVPALLAAMFVVVWALGQALAATNVPRTAVGSTTPGDLGLSYRDVTFESADGVKLSGWYLPSTNRAAVILLHGAGSTRSSVLDHAAVLARHRFGVLLFDARGHGRSSGRAMDFGWWGDEDIVGALSFLQAQPDVDPGRLGAVGLSMGGEEAIGAAGGDSRLRAVVSEGATNRVTGDKAWLSEEFGWRGTIQEGIEWVLYNTTDLLTAADQPITLREAVAAAAPRPVLLIAGGAEADEADASRYIQSGAPGTVDLWIVPDAKHTGALDAEAEQWEQRVVAFLTDALAAGPTTNSP